MVLDDFTAVLFSLNLEGFFLFTLMEIVSFCWGNDALGLGPGLLAVPMVLRFLHDGFFLLRFPGIKGADLINIPPLSLTFVRNPYTPTTTSTTVLQ